MSAKWQGYVYGTAAKKLDYDVYEENEFLKARKQEKEGNRQKMKILMHVMLCCTLALVMMYRYCLLTEMNYNVSKKYSEYEQLKNSNIALRVSVEKEADLLKIKEIAQNKLDMQAVDKAQVVYVKVPTNDFIKYGDNTKTENGMGKVILSKLSNLKKYM